MVKRRVKLPATTMSEETDTESSDNIYKHRFLDFEAEKRRQQEHEVAEEFGRKIGIVLHWLIYIPLRICLVIINITWHALLYTLKNLGSIAYNTWLIFTLGGVIYIIYLIRTAS